MIKGDKVKILNGFYLGMEGYIEDFKDGQCIVALKNENGYVNTMMYPKRLELVEPRSTLRKIQDPMVGELNMAYADIMMAKKTARTIVYLTSEYVDDSISYHILKNMKHVMAVLTRTGDLISSIKTLNSPNSV